MQPHTGREREVVVVTQRPLSFDRGRDLIDSRCEGGAEDVAGGLAGGSGSGIGSGQLRCGVDVRSSVRLAPHRDESRAACR